MGLELVKCKINTIQNAARRVQIQAPPLQVEMLCHSTSALTTL